MSTRPEYVWHFNRNRRIYANPEPGRIYSSGGPIYREHWEKLPVVGETARSWLVGFGRPNKVPKKGGMRGFAFTDQEVEDDIFVNANAYKLGEYVGRLADAELLRTIAKLTGFQTK